MSRWLPLFAAALTSACVTINVYFPAAAAERAADRIIDEVWGRDPAGTGGKSEPSGRLDAVPAVLARALLDLIVPAAHAQQPDLDVSTPAIAKITASMESRHARLLGYWRSGAIGLTGDGLVAVRDAKAVPLAERASLNGLVADENADRNALYREIARANGHPEWEANIRDTFARRWIDRADRGWWYRGASGWQQK